MELLRGEKAGVAMWRRLTAVCVLSMTSAAANALLIDYGTSEAITFRDCVAGISGCDDASNLVRIVYGGYPGAPYSSASYTLPGYGTATGAVGLSGTIGAPLLTASATSQPGTRENTNSIALQRYVYTGTDPTTRTFGGTLTYTQTFTGTYPFEVGDGINAAIDIFTLTTDMVDVGDTPASNSAALFSPESFFPGYHSLASAQYRDTNLTSSGPGTFAATVTLNPGDAIWVWVLLQTPAPNGSSVDAAHTLITGWDDPTGLVPAIVAVPEPTTPALVILGLAAIGFSVRPQWRKLALPERAA